MEKNKSDSVKEFEALDAQKKLDILYPRIQVLISMVKDTEFNMRKFLIPKGSIQKDSMFATDFYAKYYSLFPKEKPVEDTKSI